MMPTVSVIICTYNRANSLAQTLDSLQCMTIPSGLNWELILVDNNSKDHTKQVVEEFAPIMRQPLEYVFEQHPGLSQARNTGIAHAKGNLIIFTDDDVLVDKDWLSKIVEAFEDYDCIAVGGRIFPIWPGPKPSWFQDKGPFATPKAIVYFDLGEEVCIPGSSPYGANMAFRRRAFEEYGTFRVDLGRVGDTLMGGEDIEFFERLKKGSEKILYIPDAIVHHPITKDRIEKKYFERWCFNAAQTAVRFEGLPQGSIYYFGLPRYYFRNLLTNLVKYLFAFRSDRRFFYKLQVYIIVGRLLETRKLSKQSTRHN